MISQSERRRPTAAEVVANQVADLESLLAQAADRSAVPDAVGAAVPPAAGSISGADPSSDTGPVSPPPVEDAVEPAEPEVSWADVRELFTQRLKRSCSTVAARRRLYFGVVVAATVIGFIPWPHQITCEVICEPAERRYVSCPFDARLLKSHVKAGQQVEVGQLLAMLDGSELRSELAGKRAVLSQAQQRHFAALAVGDHSKAENERLEVEYLQREIDLLESRSDRLEVRSPINGVVISGDLERVTGAPLSIGDNMFELASLDELIAEVAVPEADVIFVEDNMQVNVVLDAAPGEKRQSSIATVHLRNEIRNSTSVYIAEVPLENENHLFRPGMSGTGTVHAGFQPLGWVVFRRPYEAFRKTFGG